jgi:hypothetical protein
MLWALDHAALALVTMGKCKPYEMISSVLWDLELAGKFLGFLRPVVDFVLRPIGANHCENSWKWQQHLYTRGLQSPGQA